MSFLSFIHRNWAVGTAQGATPRLEPTIAANPANAQYPAVDPGIPTRTVEQILEANHDVIAKIKMSYGSDNESFANEVLSIVRRYAMYVNVLPATADNCFDEPGGLVRIGLETAFYALQGTDSQIFAGRATITNRRHLEPRWRLATFIAGLCSEIHRTLSHVLVTDPRGDEWKPYLAPLTGWLDERKADRFFVKWTPRAQEIRSLGVFALPMIVPPTTMSHLAEGNLVVVPHMMASISGLVVYYERNVLDQLVRRASALVIDRNLQASATRHGRPKQGAHLERHLVDALRRLVIDNKAWVPNADHSRVWYGVDGLFLVWPGALVDVAKLLEADQIRGVPKSSETILEILVESGVVEPGDDGSATRLIHPLALNKPLEAVRIASPAILLAVLTPSPEPLKVRLLVGDNVVAATAAAPGTAPPPAHGGGARPAKSDVSTTVAPPQALRTEPDGGQMELPGLAVATPPANHARPGRGEREGLDEVPAYLNEGALGEPSVPGGGAPGGDVSRLVFSLAEPMRLNRSVAEALRDIVSTMNAGGAATACRTVATGLFVPLAQFAKRQIDPRMAVRSLTEAGMLMMEPGAKTPLHEFCGERVAGAVIAPGFVSGLRPEDFQSPGT